MDDLGMNLNSSSDNSIVISGDGLVGNIPMKVLGATQIFEQNLQLNLWHACWISHPTAGRETTGKTIIGCQLHQSGHWWYMVKYLDISREIMLTTKRKLKEKLKKFKILFGGGPGGKLDIKPINIELKPGTKPYAGTNYNVLKGLGHPSRKKGKEWWQMTS